MIVEAVRDQRGPAAAADLLRQLAAAEAAEGDQVAPVAAFGTTAYEEHKRRAARRSADLSAAGRDIGEIPPPADPARRAACRKSLERFAKTYLASKFPLPWGAAHVAAIERIERTIFDGGRFALGMPRGSGKTQLFLAAVCWAVLYAHRRYVLMVAADDEAAKQLLRGVKQRFEAEPLLVADFPEVCVPILALEGIANRAPGQLCCGQPTALTWATTKVVLPTIAGSRASGIVIESLPILGPIRGRHHETLATGEVVRPDLVLIDDPQTRRSASARGLVRERELIVDGDIAELAGPTTAIAAFAAVTVIKPNDLADRLLNRELKPEWNGQKTPMLTREPAATELWERYRELRQGGHFTAANEYYQANREAMDAGGETSWEARVRPGEVSALQSAMNRRIDNPATFAAEFQLSPEIDGGDGVIELDVLELQSQVGRAGRWELPAGAEKLTAFVDVQGAALYWLVAAWSLDFTGQVVAYGTWPEQPSDYYTLAALPRTLRDRYAATDLDTLLYRGLDDLAERLFGRQYTREDGQPLELARVLIDANWGKSTHIIRRWAQETPHAARVYPAHGRGVTASNRPLSEYEPRPGELGGLEWRLAPTKQSRQRHAHYDANYWKSFCADRLRIAYPSPGSLVFYAATPARHRMIAEHCTAERGVRKKARSGRTVDEWEVIPGSGDNHFWDCLVGAAAAASIEGCALLEADRGPRIKKRRSMAEVKAANQQRRR